MSNQLICPMLTTNTVVDEEKTIKIGTQPVICIQDQCGWWVEDKQKCAITAIGGVRHGK